MSAKMYCDLYYCSLLSKNELLKLMVSFWENWKNTFANIWWADDIDFLFWNYWQMKIIKMFSIIYGCVFPSDAFLLQSIKQQHPFKTFPSSKMVMHSNKQKWKLLHGNKLDWVFLRVRFKTTTKILVTYSMH